MEKSKKQHFSNFACGMPNYYSVAAQWVQNKTYSGRHYRKKDNMMIQYHRIMSILSNVAFAEINHKQR